MQLSHLCATCLVHFSLLDKITQMIFNEKNIAQSSSLENKKRNNTLEIEAEVRNCTPAHWT
jgi:hypothetical protein